MNEILHELVVQIALLVVFADYGLTFLVVNQDVLLHLRPVQDVVSSHPQVQRYYPC